MQADPIEEIDRIIAEDLRAKMIPLSERDSVFLAHSIRLALREAGYAIVLDEAQLLEKGEKLFKPVRSA